MFLEEKNDYYEIEDNYQLLVKVKDTPTVLGTLTITQGLPTLEF
jgi:hypothetical protein